MNTARGWVPLIVLLVVGVPLGTWMAVPGATPASSASPRAGAHGEKKTSPAAAAPTVRRKSADTSAEARDPSDQALQDLMSRAQQTGKPPRFIFASFPDPLENPSSRFFDEYLAALRIALESAGYSKFESWDPWFPAGGETIEGQPWRTHPGLTLFRNGKGEQWAVFLIGETPTRGIHHDALSKALDFWMTTDSPDKHDGVVRVLGPATSGASRSLAITLNKWLRDHRHAGVIEVRIVTGSATSATNVETFRALAESQSPDLKCKGPDPGSVGGEAPVEDAFGPVRISFEATVHDDDSLTAFVTDYLLRQLRISPDQTAILTESSSAYGQDFADGNGDAAQATHRPLVLRYPPYISSVRQSYAHLTPEGATAPAGAPALDLENEDERTAELFAPHSSVSRSMADLSLARVIRAISEEHIQAVEIVALDPQDAAFLANKVRLAFPAVVVVVLSSDVLYLHQQYALDGLLIASTYPLSNMSQRTTFAFAGIDTRLSFPSEQAEGVFNASLVLVGKHELLDYGPPLRVQAHAQTPALWMSVVSNHELWPVEVRTRQDLVNTGILAEANYVHPEPSSSGTPAEAWRPGRAVGLDALVLLFSLFSLGCVVCYAWARCLGPDPPASSSPLLVRMLGHLPNHPQDKWRRVSTSMLLLVFSVLWSFIAIVTWGGTHRPTEAALSSVFSSLTSPATLLTLVAVLSACAHSTLDGIGVARKGARVRRNQLFVVLMALGIGALIVGATYALMNRWLAMCGFGHELVAPLVDLRCQRFVLFLDRARALGSGVSLIATFSILALGYFIWYSAHLRRIWLTNEFLPLRTLKLFAPTVEPTQRAVDDSLRKAFDKFESIIPSPALWFVMVGFLLVAFIRALGLPFFESAQYRWVTAAVSALFLMLLVFGCGRSLELWVRLRQLLHQVATVGILDEYAKVPAELLGYLVSPWSPQVAQAWLASGRTASRHVGERFEIIITKEGAVDGREWRRYLDGTAAPCWAGVEEKGRGQALLRVLYLAASVAYLRKHLLNFLRATSAGLLVLLFVVSMYPLRGERLLLGMVVALGTATASIVTVIFTQLGNDYVISRLGGKVQGVPWDPEFIRGLLLHAVLPLVGLLSLRFPSIGQVLKALLGPLSGASGGG